MRLTAVNISKKIKSAVILEQVNLDLASGTVYGFTGRNGSGKTMLFRALSGLMRVDSGTISLEQKVLGQDFSVLPSLGIVLENAGLYPEFTGLQNLKILAKLRNRIGEKEIIKAIKRVGLDPKDRRTFGKYSLGMKQRLVIAQAVMEKPDVIMLDEPTNAIDSFGIDEIRKLILEEKERGALILIASHSKDDIEKLTDRVFHLENGRVTTN